MSATRWMTASDIPQAILGNNVKNCSVVFQDKTRGITKIPAEPVCLLTNGQNLWAFNFGMYGTLTYFMTNPVDGGFTMQSFNAEGVQSPFKTWFTGYSYGTVTLRNFD